MSIAFLDETWLDDYDSWSDDNPTDAECEAWVESCGGYNQDQYDAIVNGDDDYCDNDLDNWE